MKAFKYINTTVFALAALSIIDFITSSGLEVAGRFQYNEFDNPTIYRTIADFLLLTSLILLAMSQWTPKKKNPVYFISALTYILIIFPDINTWLWLTNGNPIYLVILIIHTLPFLMIFHNFNIDLNLDFKFTLTAGIFFLLFAFIYDIVIINITYPDPAPEVYDKFISNLKILSWLYYIGIILTITGLTHILTRIKVIT